ncbi:site-specific DNA-methyltransferase [Candidatus Microgenomates bacterium]|nr:site-specific DNA-methyltransferase [Candidatus Microgenomates bacterium]
MARSKIRNLQLKTYIHPESKRVNNPPVGLVSSQTDKTTGRTQYEHDPYIDPFLSWAGKKEGISFEVPNVSLHIHERIDSQRIAKAFLKKKAFTQPSLFEDPFNDLPLFKAAHFYEHEQDWANRLIAGDSLLVMNSLLQKEGMAGKVQMIYLDPPYGIKYNSNFQPFLNKRDVKDRDEDIPAEPEMIKAFRDTWELGIHSYLTYLYDRLILARELLKESGSVFVQISDENVHHVKELMDEVFGPENFCSVVTFAKTSGFSPILLSNVSNYLLWYAKDKEQTKYRQLYKDKSEGRGINVYQWVELKDGVRRKLTKEEREEPALIPKGSKLFRLSDICSQGETGSNQEFKFEGKTYFPRRGTHWSTSVEGLKRLVGNNRIMLSAGYPNYVRYLDDYPVTPISNLWDDTGTGSFTDPKIYVVQTGTKIIQRCILMTTDSGDLVFDPTCGSGTTAYVSEQWGRRWITCDTSRVAIALAKQRLMAAKFDYYELAHLEEGVASGFQYKKASHITLGSIAKEESAQEETLYDQPVVDRNKIRVTGPFTVEAVPSLRTKPFEGNELKILARGTEIARIGETNNISQWIDELKATGIRATGGKVIQFHRIDLMPGSKYLHAEAEVAVGEPVGEAIVGSTQVVATEKAVISFGPDYGPMDQRQVEEAMKEAFSLKDVPQYIIFASFHFDPEASKDIDLVNQSKTGFIVLKTQMSVDLLTSDLRKQRSSNQSYWLIGQPDVELIKKEDETYQVKVNGFDYYNPITGEIESGSDKQIAMWMLDTDYDEQSILPQQVFFPTGDSNRDWTKLAKALNGEVDEELLERFTGTISLPFTPGDNKKIAVKIIDNRGIESFVVKEI